MTTPVNAAAPAPQIKIEIPADLEGIYVNFALISHSASELVLDFARLLPNTPQAKVQARLIMTPINAKLLMHALGENLGKFEAQYGEIIVPAHHTLADQLCRTPPPDDANNG